MRRGRSNTEITNHHWLPGGISSFLFFYFLFFFFFFFFFFSFLFPFFFSSRRRGVTRVMISASRAAHNTHYSNYTVRYTQKCLIYR